MNSLPEFQLSQTHLVFPAMFWGKKLAQTVTVTNSITDTLLEGKWEVVSFAFGSDLSDCSWISISPTEFSGNQVEFQIQVDTSKLMADYQYYCFIRLYSNASQNDQL